MVGCPTTKEHYAYWPKRGFDEARKAAKLEGGPHTLRHTYASHFLASTPDLFLLARVLGHSDTRVTRLYAHLLPDHLARARDAVSLAPKIGPATLEAAKRWKVEPKALSGETVPTTVPKATSRNRTSKGGNGGN
jgi:hypothetical protein